VDRIAGGGDEEANGSNSTARDMEAMAKNPPSARAFSEKARMALELLGVGETQLQSFAEGQPIAFNLSGATESPVTVAQFTREGRLRVGIYTIKNEGGGLGDFLTFESRAQAAARAIGATELELMGVEVTNLKLRAALERGGFTQTTMAVPEELGGGIFTDVISRVEPVK
jgi:hypothetical protein